MPGRSNGTGNDLLYTVAGLVALLLVAWLFYIQFTSFHSAQKALGEEQARLDRTRALIRQLQVAKEQVAVFRHRIDRMRRQIPPDPQEEEVILELQTLAAGSGVKFLEVEFKEHKSTKKYREIPFTARFEGNYGGLTTLLEKLRHGIRAMRVDQMELTRKDEKDSQIEAELKAGVFYAPQ